MLDKINENINLIKLNTKILREEFKKFIFNSQIKISLIKEKFISHL
jgi:hypothetical protein